MKIGIIKLGSRISYGGRDTSGGNGEVRSIIRILQTIPDVEITVFTKILSKDNLVDGINFVDIENAVGHLTGLSTPNYTNSDFGVDALLVINGNVNFFGGGEDRAQILNYAMIENYDGPVFYILCDPALQFKQIWPSVSKKPWSANYSERDINIQRNDIKYICQPFRTDLLKEIIDKNDIGVNEITHFPFEQFPCLNEILPAVPLSDLTADLSYGGTMRGGKREKAMINFYFGYSDDIDVEMFGKIELDDFKPKLINGLRPPRFSGTVKYDDFLPRMNKVLSTVVIGDPLYEKLEDLNQRLYESIWANVVTFVDVNFDKNKRAFGHDKDLSDFLYVENRKDVEERIRLVKSDANLREGILQAQIEAVNFDKHKYSQSLLRIITKDWT